jgi:hypothetical protein
MIPGLSSLMIAVWGSLSRLRTRFPASPADQKVGLQGGSPDLTTVVKVGTGFSLYSRAELGILPLKNQ